MVSRHSHVEARIISDRLEAKMHGYDYKFVQVPPVPEGYHGTWAKLGAIRDALGLGYKFIVFTDGDIIFPHLKMPMEYLFDYWNITSEIAVALGYEPDTPGHVDHTPTHRRTLNTGFMIIQDIPVTKPLFQDWVECPTDVKFTNCSAWKDEPFHEQEAWADYIRYAYPNRDRELPCGEVNGSPYHVKTGKAFCGGTLVTHYWTGKEKVKEAAQAAIAAVVMPSVIDDLTATWTNGQHPGDILSN